jgi:glycosyltransferase involved in cell wall biosynthesis
MKPKILFILHLPPPVHGASMIGQTIKRSRVINDSFNCRFINPGTSLTIDEIGRNPFGKLLRYFRIIRLIFRQLIHFRPDLCYFTLTASGPGFYKDFPLVFLIKLFRIKLIYHFHNKGVQKHQNKFLPNILYRMVFKNARVILLSEYLYPDIMKYVPEEKTDYCPNGITDNLITSPGKTTENDVVILFLSNLIESKGVFILLEACRILAERNLNFRCRFVGGAGDINEQQFNTRVKELNLENHVRYAGRKYGDEKNIELAGSDIFAFPTFYDFECFPLVLLEAMQYSLPVVSTFEGAIQEIVTDGVNGFLVAQKNTITLADKLEILIRDPELRLKMGKAGRNKFEKEYTVEKFEENMKEILIVRAANQDAAVNPAPAFRNEAAVNAGKPVRKT